MIPWMHKEGLLMAGKDDGGICGGGGGDHDGDGDDDGST